MTPAFQTYYPLPNPLPSFGFLSPHLTTPLASPLKPANHPASTPLPLTHKPSNSNQPRARFNDPAEPDPPVVSRTTASKPPSEPPSKPLSGIHLGLVSGWEVTSPLPLHVVGDLPPYLACGTYYQNGPGLFQVRHKDGQYFEPEHWFDSLGMVHAFFFDAANGTVHYRSKMTSEAVKRTIESMPKDQYVAMNISRHEQPHSTLHRLRHSLGPMSIDPVTRRKPFNVSVTLQQLPTKGILNASTDANIIHRLHPDTLETVEEFDFTYFHHELTDSVTSSHGILDPVSGEYFNFTMGYMVGKTIYKVFRIKPDGKTEVMATIVDYPYYMHSFSVTEHYVILVMCPCEVSLFKILGTKSFTDGIRMRPDTPTRFVVISRKSSKVVCTYEHEAFFCLHTVNAFDRGDDIVIDLAKYKDPKIITDLRLQNLKSGGDVDTGVLTRFILPRISEQCLKEGNKPSVATSKPLGTFPFEFGVVAPDRVTRQHRYIYGLSDELETGFYGTISKVDVESGKVLNWSSAGMFTGEPLFVPNPSGKSEDDGCLLVTILDSVNQKSALLLLDAQTMIEVSRAILPMTVPLGFHGFFRSGRSEPPVSVPGAPDRTRHAPRALSRSTIVKSFMGKLLRNLVLMFG